MKPKTKNIIRVIFIIICFCGGLSALGKGFRGFLAAPFLIGAGLLAIPKVTDSILFLRQKAALPIICSIALFLFGGMILPKSARSSQTVPDVPDRSVPVSSGDDLIQETTVLKETTALTETTVKEQETTVTENETTVAVTETTIAVTEAATEPVTEAPATQPRQQSVRDWVVNEKTKKIHYPSCHSVDEMDEENKGYYSCTFQELKDRGYEPCGKCNPH